MKILTFGEVLGGLAVGGTAGFFVFGPIGAAIGAAVGGGIGTIIAEKKGKTTAASSAMTSVGLTPTLVGLPVPPPASLVAPKAPSVVTGMRFVHPGAAPAPAGKTFAMKVPGQQPVNLAPAAGGMSQSQAAAQITAIVQGILATTQPDPNDGITGNIMHQVIMTNLNSLITTPTASNLSTVIGVLNRPNQGNEAAAVLAQLQPLRQRIGYTV